MKKLTVILLLLLLTGCKAPVPEQMSPRLVTRVCIRSEGLQWEYTDSKKIAAVLDYLRFLPKESPNILDPEQMESVGFTIELTYLCGEGRTYVQKGVFYLSQDALPFRPIDPSSAGGLIELLEQYPSDAPK